jgi:hypothetical protein
VLDKDEAKGKSSCCGDEITEHSSVSETSIYQTSAVWRDQENDEFMLKEMEGKRVVMALFFSNCSYACPIILNDMQCKLRHVHDYFFATMQTEVSSRGNSCMLKDHLINRNLH